MRAQTIASRTHRHRNTALVLVVAIIVACGAPPAAAQPFADTRGKVPKWAYAALESLIAHGLVPKTLPRQRRERLQRAELARLLAPVFKRLTTRQPADRAQGRMTASDLAALRRLLREFESELAALDVRAEAVHRQLQDLAFDVRAVRITGDVRVRYEIGRVALNNPGTGPVAPASTQPALPAAAMRIRLAFDGGVNDDLRLRLRLSTLNQMGTTVGLFGGAPPTGQLNSLFIPLNSSALSRVATLTLAEFDWMRAFGNPDLRIRLGRLGGDPWIPREGDPLIPTAPPPGRTTALQLGPIGLLFNTAKDVVGETSLRTYAVDALAVTYATPQFGALAIAGGSGSATFYAGRVQAPVAPGVVVGGNVMVFPCYQDGGVDNSALVSALNTVGAGAGVSRCAFVWWGAQNGWIPSLNTGSTNPITNLDGSGYSIDLDATLTPWLRLQAEVGLWNDTTARKTGYGWQAQLVIGDPTSQSPTVVLGYQSFDSAFTPSYGAAEDPVVGFIYPGGFQNWFIVARQPLSGWVISGGYETGTSLGAGPQPAVVGFGGPTFSAAVCPTCSPAGQPFSAWMLSAESEIGPATTIHVYYYSWQFNRASQAEVYRFELGHRF